MTNKNSNRRCRVDKWAIRFIIGLYLILGVAYSIVNPILESPDEILNYKNIRFIAEHRSLPVIQPDELSKAHHPPLYYVIGAILVGGIPAENLDDLAANVNPFWAYRAYEPGVDNKSQYLHDPALEGWPYQDVSLAIHLLRWVSLLLGTGVIMVIYATTQEMFPTEPALAWSAAALVAFNPMFLFIQGSVHNDALTNFLAALTILAIVRYWQRGPTAGRAALVGIVAALGILTKITFLFLGPMIFLAMMVRSWLNRGQNPDWWREAGRMLIIGGGLVLLLAGWWFVRNQVLYGEPTSMRSQVSVWRPREGAPDWVGAWHDLGFLRDSFWGVFGWGQIPLHRPIYTALWVMELIALGGILLWVFRARRIKGIYRASPVLIAMLSVAPLTALGATFGRMVISPSANFGRYLFTTSAVLAPFLLLGLTEWIPITKRRLFSGGLTAVFFLFSLYGLVGVLRPAYTFTSVYTAKDAIEAPIPLSVEYPGKFKLIGYDLSPASAVPGERIDVTLYWEVTENIFGNYPLFVQLVTHDNRRIAGRDTHAGLGRYPTGLWQQGEIIVDTVPLYIAADEAAGPTGLVMNIGIYDEAGNLLETAVGDTTVTVGHLRLANTASILLAGEQTAYNLDDVAELAAVAPPPLSAAPGAQLPFTLTWRALQSPGIDYIVFVHLLAENGELTAAFDSPPAAGAYPTSLWQPGDVVIDERMLTLAPDLSPGTYSVMGGWYRLDNLTRLSVTDEAGRPLPDAAIPLFTLQIEAAP